MISSAILLQITLLAEENNHLNHDVQYNTPTKNICHIHETAQFVHLSLLLVDKKNTCRIVTKELHFEKPEFVSLRKE